MRVFGVVAVFAIVFSGLTSAARDAPEVRDGLTIAELGVNKPIRLDINNPAIDLPVALNSDFRQGDNNRWLMFRIHFRISYPLAEHLPTDAIPDIQHVLSASMGSSTAVQIVVTREGDQLSANGIGWAEGSVTKFSTSETIEMTYSNYFPEYLSSDGDTKLRLTFEVSDRARDTYAEIFPDSGFIETIQSPNSLVLDVIDVGTYDDENGGIFAVIHYSIVNELSRTAEFELVFFDESGEQIPLDISKQYRLLGYQSVTGEAVVPMQHQSQDFRGNLVAVSGESNSPSVAIELSREPGISYTVHIFGLAIGGMLLILGSYFVVRLTNKHMNVRRERLENSS